MIYAKPTAFHFLALLKYIVYVTFEMRILWRQHGHMHIYIEKSW